MPSASGEISARRLLIWGAALQVCYLLPVLLPAGNPVLPFLLSNAASVIVLGCLILIVRRGGAWRRTERSGIAVLLGWALVFRLTMLFGEPAASDDIYRYLWDGRVVSNGVNPYLLPPADVQLEHLHTEDLPSKVTYPEMRTIYPPLAVGFFGLSHVMFGPSVTGLRLLLVLCDAAAMMLLLALLRKSRIPDTAVVAYAWCPVPVLYGALDGHLDILGVPFVLAALFAAQGGRRAGAGLLIGLGGLARVFPLLALPLQSSAGNVRDILRATAAGGAVFLAGCLPFLEETGGLTESFLVFSSTWEFNGAVFPVLKQLLGSGVTARIICAASLGVIVSILALRRTDAVRKTMLAFCALVLFMPTVHPWYLILLAPFPALRWSGGVAWLLAASGLANITVLGYRGGGPWVQHPWVQAAEYVPFLLLLAWEAWKRRGVFAPGGAEVSR